VDLVNILQAKIVLRNQSLC